MRLRCVEPIYSEAGDKQDPEQLIHNKKAIPLYRAAYELALKLEKIAEEKAHRLSRLQQFQRSASESRQLRSSSSQSPLRGGTRDDRSQDPSRSHSLRAHKDVTEHKRRMCPFRASCPYSVRSSQTAFQVPAPCPYAHHHFELHFP